MKCFEVMHLLKASCSQHGLLQLI